MAGSVLLAQMDGRPDAARAGQPAPFDARLIDAALRCVARWGVAKTTLEDIAREAGCSRATVYRAFPGGKDALFDAVVHVEVDRFIERIRSSVEAAASIDDALVAVVTEAGRTIHDHAALQFLLANEPGLVLPKLAFGELDALFEQIRSVGGPLLARFFGGDEARGQRVAEWVARITLSYTLSPAPGLDTTDGASVRTLVTTFVLPGIQQLGVLTP